MATRKKASETETGGDALKSAAKAIGSAIGTVAAKTGLAGEATPPRKKVGKLAKSAKKRLPRKEKKRVKKLAEKSGK